MIKFYSHGDSFFIPQNEERWRDVFFKIDETTYYVPMIPEYEGDETYRVESIIDGRMYETDPVTCLWPEYHQTWIEQFIVYIKKQKFEKELQKVLDE